MKLKLLWLGLLRELDPPDPQLLTTDPAVWTCLCWLYWLWKHSDLFQLHLWLRRCRFALQKPAELLVLLTGYKGFVCVKSGDSDVLWCWAWYHHHNERLKHRNMTLTGISDSDSRDKIKCNKIFHQVHSFNHRNCLCLQMTCLWLSLSLSWRHQRSGGPYVVWSSFISQSAIPHYWFPDDYLLPIYLFLIDYFSLL